MFSVDEDVLFHEVRMLYLHCSRKTAASILQIRNDKGYVLLKDPVVFFECNNAYYMNSSFPYCRSPQVWTLRSTFLQRLAPTLNTPTCNFVVILKTLGVFDLKRRCAD